jgi:CheY-like chemotaxis protein
MGTEEKKTIMVVDDNDDVRRLVKKVLQMSGYEVLEAHSGEEALVIAEESIPDLVLMDLRLPGELNGLVATCQLKEDPRTSRIPVVALTASVMEKDRKQALQAGCCGFIGKPIDISALPILVEKMITRGAAAPR